jgi:hypothetical protein
LPVERETAEEVRGVPVTIAATTIERRGAWLATFASLRRQ